MLYVTFSISSLKPFSKYAFSRMNIFLLMLNTKKRRSAAANIEIEGEKRVAE
jgi:hypothetical protein